MRCRVFIERQKHVQRLSVDQKKWLIEHQHVFKRSSRPKRGAPRVAAVKAHIPVRTSDPGSHPPLLPQPPQLGLKKSRTGVRLAGPLIDFIAVQQRTLLRVSLGLIILSSIIPAYINIQSYFWEKRRVNGVEKDVLYNLFLMEGIHQERIYQERILQERITGGAGKKLPSAYHFKGLPTLKVIGYTVRKGDSLFSISQKFGISVDSIITANRLRNAHYLNAGTKLKIPNRSGVFYTVKKGDNLSAIAKRYSVSVNSVADMNDLAHATIHEGQELFLPLGTLSEWERAIAFGTLFKRPARGRLTSRVGFRIDPFTGKMAFHAGIDIANRVGTPVVSSQYGRVTYAGYLGNYGKTVIIVHPQGYETLYAHLHKILVKKGQAVSQGEKIGTLGNSGRSIGPHLHLEVHQNKKLIDPLKVVKMR